MIAQQQKENVYLYELITQILSCETNKFSFMIVIFRFN